MKKERINAELPCNPSCRSRLNSVCIKLPAIGLVSNRVYHLKDSQDPSSGEYREESPLVTQTPRICPFTKPARSINGKLTETENEVEDAGITESQQPKPLNIGQIIKKGLRSKAGVALASTYIGLSVYYGTKEVINYFQPPIPDIGKLASDFYQYIQPFIDPIVNS